MSSDNNSEQEQRNNDSPITYYPIYDTTTTGIPQEYLLEFTRIAYRGNGIRWRLVHPNGRTIEYCYESFKGLRPADDSSAHGDFTYFTFVIVDDQCINEKPWKCIVACDAPDIDEGPEEIKLKHYRLPLEQGVGCLYRLEDLTCDPSEAQNPNRMVKSMHPPPTMVLARFTEDGQPTFRPATRAEAKRNKKQFFMQLEATAHGNH